MIDDMTERKAGNSRLVYNKVTRTIDTVRTTDTATATMTWLKRIALGIVVAVGMMAVVAAGYRGHQIMVRDAVIEALEMREAGR